MNTNLLLGAKYYRYDEQNNIEVIRIYKFNDLEVKAYLDNDKEDKRKLTMEELNKNYVRLNPHSIINFCIVKIKDGLDDVIVMMHKMSDLQKEEPTPYCACRQNITDVFANQIRLSDKLYVGCCMSLETCPPDVDYRIMLACDKISKCINLCAYMDDTLESILDIVKTKEFDITLQALFADHVKFEIKQNPVLESMKSRIMSLDTYNGYCQSLKTLLEQNNFMYDFYRGFNIIPIDKEVTYDNEGVLNPEITKIIGDIFEVNITSTLCMPYWYDIDLSQIDNTYVLLMDKNDNLFVVAYVSIGPKHIEIENVETPENIEKMINSTIASNKSVKEAAEYIRINKNKYK